jgi:hypothetical protein
VSFRVVETRDEMEVQPVEHLQAPLLVTDDAGRFQYGEMTRYGRSSEADRVDQVANALLAGGQLADDNHATGMSERLEYFGGAVAGGHVCGVAHDATIISQYYEMIKMRARPDFRP